MQKNFIHYLITDSGYYTSNPRKFKQKLTQSFQSNNINFACFRAKDIRKTYPNRYKRLASIFVKLCKRYKIKSFINSDIKIANSLGYDGVHLTSNQLKELKLLTRKYKLTTIISTHDERQIKRARLYEADYITYSPIFFTPNKGKPKGIIHLKDISKRYRDMNIIALGGIVDNNHIKKIKLTYACGFASIRYFV
jgi:thiamine-phosphate pyrophosphorylase